MAQVLQDELNLPELNNIDTFDRQKSAKITIPKTVVFNYKFAWVPNIQDIPKETYPFPMIFNPMLYCLTMDSLSKPCYTCGDIVFPKYTDKMKVPQLCKKCRTLPRQREPEKFELKRSSALDRLRDLLDSIFIKYHINSEVQENSDYTKRWQHSVNQEIYMKFTIIKDAVEVASCIDSLITFNKWPKDFFVWNGKTHHDLLQDVISNDGILKLEPFYRLLMMPSSILKAKEMTTIPMMRGARMSPGNVTNMSSLQQK